MNASSPRGSTRLSARGGSMIVVALLVLVGLWWLVSGDGDDVSNASHDSQGRTASAQVSDPASGLPIIAVADLPDEAVQTMELIADGGPFPYDKDGAVFSNFEGILPQESSGYYREYTVPTPGSDDRGARRIVSGGASEMYYTDDHYDSFALIEGTG